jgi:hypothetical protein
MEFSSSTVVALPLAMISKSPFARWPYEGWCVSLSRMRVHAVVDGARRPRLQDDEESRSLGLPSSLAVT